MAPHKPIRFVVSPELRKAIDQHCQTHGLELSSYIRGLIAADLQRPELLETVRPEGAPQKKAAKKT